MVSIGSLSSPLQHIHIFYLILTSFTFILRTILWWFLKTLMKNLGQSVSKISLKFCNTYKVNKSNKAKAVLGPVWFLAPAQCQSWSLPSSFF